MKKEAVIDKLQRARKKIIDLIEPLPEETWKEVFLGTWCLKDVAAHFIGWDGENLKSIKEICLGTLPSCFEHYDENWVSYNKLLVARYKKGNKSELIAAMNASHTRYVDALKNIPEDLFYKDFGIRWQRYKITVAVNASYEASDEKIHTQQIVRWVRKRNVHG